MLVLTRNRMEAVLGGLGALRAVIFSVGILKNCSL